MTSFEAIAAINKHLEEIGLSKKKLSKEVSCCYNSLLTYLNYERAMPIDVMFTILHVIGLDVLLVYKTGENNNEINRCG